MSFGYSFGQPKHADLILDARGFECAGKELRKKYTGLSKPYQNAFYSMDVFTLMYNKLKGNVKDFLSSTERDVVIAIGCHRGKHRSVAIVEKLAIELNGCTQHVNIQEKYKSLISKKRNEKYSFIYDT